MAQARTVTLKKNSDLNAARRVGADISIEKKWAAGSNKQRVNHKNVNKLEDETESFHVEHVGLNLGQIIQRARAEKGISQKDLAAQINEKSTVVTEYEQGRAQPNPNVLGKMERILGVKLRGKDKGQPIVKKVPKK